MTMIVTVSVPAGVKFEAMVVRRDYLKRVVTMVEPGESAQFYLHKDHRIELIEEIDQTKGEQACASSQPL